MILRIKIHYITCLLLCLSSAFSYAGDNYADPWDDCSKDSLWIDKISDIPETYKDFGSEIHISDATSLAWFSLIANNDTNYYLDKTIYLDNDVSLCGGLWKPVEVFTGTFDGQGHIISNLYSDTSDIYISSCAMFSKNVGNIKNLILDRSFSIDISRKMRYSSLVGVNNGYVSNCSVKGYIKLNYPKSAGDLKIGALVSENQGVVEYSNFYGTIYVDYIPYNESAIGGVVGGNTGLVNACVNEGTVISNAFQVGGVVGTSTGRIVNCANKGEVLGKGRFGDHRNAVYTGGVVGVISKKNDLSGVLSNSYSIGYTDGKCLVGEADGQTMVNCYKIGSTPSIQDTYNFSYTYYLTDSVPDPTWYQGNVGFTKNGDSFILSKETWGTTDFVEALNSWVKEQNDSIYLYWTIDTLGVNNGYPYFTESYNPSIPKCELLEKSIIYEREDRVCKDNPFNVRVQGADSCSWYVNDSLVLVSNYADIMISSNYLDRCCLTAEISKDECKFTIHDTIIFDKFSPFLMKGWNDVVAISNADSDFIAYQWYRDDVELFGETDQYYYQVGGLIAGKYHAKVWNSNGQIIETCPVIVNEDWASRAVAPCMDLYPNPVQEYRGFNISLKGIDLSNIKLLQIIDNLGNVILSSKEIFLNKEFFLPEGIYLVYLELSDGEIISNKIIVLK